jgi:hypothetical protein
MAVDEGCRGARRDGGAKDRNMSPRRGGTRGEHPQEGRHTGDTQAQEGSTLRRGGTDTQAYLADAVDIPSALLKLDVIKPVVVVERRLLRLLLVLEPVCGMRGKQEVGEWLIKCDTVHTTNDNKCNKCHIDITV